MAKLEFLLTDQIQNAIPNLDSVVKALAKGDVSGLTNTPTGSIKWQFDVNGVLSFHKQNEAGTLEQILSLNIDVTKLGGYLPSVNAVVNTIPVRNSSNKIVGDLQGKAHTAGTADTLSSVLPFELGGTGADSPSNAKNNLGITALEIDVDIINDNISQLQVGLEQTNTDLENGFTSANSKINANEIAVQNLSNDISNVETDVADKVSKTGDTMTGSLNFETPLGTGSIRYYSEDKSKSVSYSPYVRNSDSSTPSYIRFFNDSNIALRVNADSGALSSDTGGWSEERIPMGQTYQAGNFGSTGTYTGSAVAIGGIIRHISSSNSKIAVLPSYGSWLVVMFTKSTSGNLTGNVTGTGIGQVIAGGTTIGSSSSSTTITGYVQRVA